MIDKFWNLLVECPVGCSKSIMISDIEEGFIHVHPTDLPSLIAALQVIEKEVKGE